MSKTHAKKIEDGPSGDNFFHYNVPTPSESLIPQLPGVSKSAALSADQAAEKEVQAHLLQLIRDVKAHAMYPVGVARLKRCVPVRSTCNRDVDLERLSKMAERNGWKVVGDWFGPADEDFSGLPGVEG